MARPQATRVAVGLKDCGESVNENEWIYNCVVGFSFSRNFYKKGMCGWGGTEQEEVVNVDM